MQRIRLNSALVVLLLLLSSVGSVSDAAEIAYIHGRVAFNGDILEEGEGSPFDPMLLSDTGSKGLSEFQLLVEGEGHTISSFRDKDTLLTQDFLDQIDVIVFGLHQKIWADEEKSALDSWLRDGGGMFIYSDSASGGSFSIVGAQNPVGQNVTNNLISQYGMEVTVDQADGIKTEDANSDSSLPELDDKEFQGEGVSPVAIAQDSTEVEILIPYTSDVDQTQGLTIEDPNYAALALRALDEGNIIVMFDRQPMWNSGPGSHIDRRDNREILASVVNFLAAGADVVDPVVPVDPVDPVADPDATIAPILDLLLNE